MRQQGSATECRVGRVSLAVTAQDALQSSLSTIATSAQGIVDSQQAPRQAFANTGHTLRLMEAMAAALHQNEPMLLVGETGTGKTTLVQQLAHKVGLIPRTPAIWVQACLQSICLLTVKDTPRLWTRLVHLRIC